MLNPELTAMLTDKISRAVDEMPPEMHCGVPDLRDLLLRDVPDLCQDILDGPWGEMLTTCRQPEASPEIEIQFAQIMDKAARNYIDGFIAGYSKRQGKAHA